MARQANDRDRRAQRRRAQVALGGLLIVAGGGPSAALADTGQGDIALPALTPEEINELGLQNAPDANDQTAPGAGEENVGDIPDNQDEGTPDPEESQGDGDDGGGPDEPGYGGPQGPAPAAPSPVPPSQAPPPAAPEAQPLAPTAEPPAATPPTGLAPPADRPARPKPAAPRTEEPAGRRAPRRIARGQGAPRPPAHAAEPATVPATPGPHHVAPPTAVPVTPRSTASVAPSDVRPFAATVVVQPGDSLWSIARRTLGPSASAHEIAAFVQRIWELNEKTIRSGTPDLIAVGERLRIPRHR